MASPNQPAGRRRSYPDEQTKMLATKDESTLVALIKGMRDPERAHAFIETEIELAQEEDREPRRGLIGMLNEKLDELRD